MRDAVRRVLAATAFAVLLAGVSPVIAADDGHHPGQHGEAHELKHDAPTVKDERASLKLSDGERAAVLAEMRGFLKSVQGIVAALADGKPAAAADAAKPSGMGATHGMPKSLMGKLPMEFRKLGMDTHQKFDALALEAQGMGDGKTMLKQLDAILANCNGCHAGYRFTGE